MIIYNFVLAQVLAMNFLLGVTSLSTMECDSMAHVSGIYGPISFAF